MQTIFKTPPAPATFTDPRNGNTFAGESWLEVGVFGPGEDHTRPVSRGSSKRLPTAQVLSHLRGAAASGRPLKADPPSHIHVTSVEIPADILDALPPESNVALTWWFTPEARI